MKIKLSERIAQLEKELKASQETERVAYRRARSLRAFTQGLAVIDAVPSHIRVLAQAQLEHDDRLRGAVSPVPDFF